MKNFNSLDKLGSLRDKFPKGTDDNLENEPKYTGLTDKDDQEEEFNKSVEMEQKDVYLLGGHDAEMRVIKNKLKKFGQEYFDRELAWGANIQDYSEQISKILEAGNTPVAVELAGAETIDGLVDIDHHNEKSNRPASLIQVMDRLGIKPSFFDELIAANDSGFIPAMEKKIKKYRSQIESKAGKDVFNELKNKWIAVIRKIDRKEQGITPEQEKQAEEAITNREDFHGGSLSIVRLPHSKCATVTDRLYGTYENLFIPSEDGESNFYGNGKLCQELKDKYEGSWSGGSGLGSHQENAFWGGYPDQEEVENYIKEKVQKISESFSRFDKVFISNNFSSFTEIGKKIYELGSFDRMNEAVDVSDIELADRGKDFIIELKPKEGWKIYSINREALAGGHTRFRDRDQEAQDTFGFVGEEEQVPPFVFLEEEEDVPNEIMRGLEERETIAIKKEYSESDQSYDGVVKKFPKVREAIQEKLESMDPRLLNYSFGKVDVSVQKTWKTQVEGGYYSDPGDASLLDTCKDFEMLGLGGYSSYSEIDKLKSGNVEVFTPDMNLSIEAMKERYEKWEQDLDKFESPINREIQVKKIDYYKRVYKYDKNKEEESTKFKNNPELITQYFAKGNIDEPLELGIASEDMEILNSFLKDKIVATYKTYGDGDYSEYLEKVGQYTTLEYFHQGRNFRSYYFNKAIETIDSGVSFSADTFAVNEIISTLKKSGYEVEGWGRSGFKSRNGFSVILPKNKIEAHIIKHGSAINGKDSISEKLWYCGETPVEINDQDEKAKVEKIIEDACQAERDKEIQEFIDEFKSKGDGTFAVIDTGGREKYQSIPDRFKVLASMRIANTQDHRQNRSHTYSNALIDTEAVKGRKSIRIKVPDKMKGLVIGKGGQNIKRISEELGMFIKII